MTGIDSIMIIFIYDIIVYNLLIFLLNSRWQYNLASTLHINDSIDRIITEYLIML